LSHVKNFSCARRNKYSLSMNLKELILKYHSKDGRRAILWDAGTEKYTSEDGPSLALVSL